MSEPQKPFACNVADCGMSFTNEDHLNVHTKKHDMVLQLGSEQKAAFVADQTPTPTRFIRNCEEVGLFQDLQNVNPFDETFKRAIEAKAGHVDSISSKSSDDVLHTPQMFPLSDSEKTMYTSTSNQSNVIISRSSSDESGVVKEFETTTISKLTNEVTISKIVNKQDSLDRPHADEHTNIINESVSYTNNVIKVHSNVEIKKDNMALKRTMPLVTYTDVVNNSIDTEILNSNVDKPLMSQKSINNVIESLTTLNDRRDDAINTNIDNDCIIIKSEKNESKIDRNIKKEEIEVIVKLPGQKKYIKMRAMDDLIDQERLIAREKIKNAILDKYEKNSNLIPKTNSNVIQIPTGTLIPVTVIKPVNTPVILQKVPIPASSQKIQINAVQKMSTNNATNKKKDVKKNKNKSSLNKVNDKKINESGPIQSQLNVSEMRSAAAKRYRDKMKMKMQTESQDNTRLKEENKRMELEINELKRLIAEHVKKCTNCDDLASESGVRSK